MGNLNPYHPDNFGSGGGRWDDQVVQITGVRFFVDELKYKDGRPVPQKRDGKIISGTQATKNVLEIKGIPVGGEKETSRKLSVGSMVPAGGGEYLEAPADKPSLQLHESTEAARFFKGLHEAGYDVSGLYPKISVLVGQRLHIKEDPTLNADGKPKTSKDGKYTETVPVPIAVVAGGATAAAPAAKGDGIAEKTDAAILKLLATGPQTKVSIIAGLSATFAGDPDSNTIIGAVVQDSYHASKPWKFDGTTLSL